MNTVRQAAVNTPIGRLHLFASEAGLMVSCFEEFIKPWRARLKLDKPKAKLAREKDSSGGASRILRDTEKQLKCYFNGELDALDTLRIAPPGTDFQKCVWGIMRRICPGTTLTYGELAKKADSPKAARAVGVVCRTNPLILVVPCHRVVGQRGHLTGFSSGLWRKEYLLEHEGVLIL